MYRVLLSYFVEKLSTPESATVRLTDGQSVPFASIRLRREHHKPEEEWDWLLNLEVADYGELDGLVKDKADKFIAELTAKCVNLDKAILGQ